MTRWAVASIGLELERDDDLAGVQLTSGHLNLSIISMPTSSNLIGQHGSDHRGS
jgi:hypothetical protein